jgi:O-antigen/teichoic acid export membrane protein
MLMRALLRDGMVYAAASIASRALALLLLPVYSRVFAPAEYGRFDLITTLGLLVSMLVALEVGQGLARFWNEAQDAAERRRLAGSALAFCVAGNATFLILAWLAAGPIAAVLLGDAAQAPVWRAGAAFIAVHGVATLLQQQFRWEIRARAYAAVSVGYAVALAACGLGAAVGLGFGLEGLLWGQCVAALGCIVVCLVLLAPSFGVRPAWPALRRMLVFSMPLVPAGAAAFASYYANRFLLAGLGSLDDVGVFGVGLRIASVIALLIVGLQGALTPLVYAHHTEPQTPATLARLFEGFVAFALPSCLALGLFAPELIRLLATPAYAAAAPLVIWLAPATLLTQMYVFAPGLAIAKKTLWQLGISVAAAVLGVALNALLIPRLGPLGAAVGTFGGAALFFGAWLSLSQRLYRLPLRGAALAIACVATVGLAALGGAFAEERSWTWRIACTAAAVAAMFALRLIRAGDLRTLVVQGLQARKG